MFRHLQISVYVAGLGELDDDCSSTMDLLMENDFDLNDQNLPPLLPKQAHLSRHVPILMFIF